MTVLPVALRPVAFLSAAALCMAAAGPAFVRGPAGWTVEPLPVGNDLESHYQTTREKLGDAFQILSHARWKGGYTDVMRTETQISSSRVKRFYRAADGRAVSLSFEARDDVFARVAPWCDQIAATLRLGTEPATP